MTSCPHSNVSIMYPPHMLLPCLRTWPACQIQHQVFVEGILIFSVVVWGLAVLKPLYATMALSVQYTLAKVIRAVERKLQRLPEGRGSRAFLAIF